MPSQSLALKGWSLFWSDGIDARIQRTNPSSPV